MLIKRKVDWTFQSRNWTALSYANLKPSIDELIIEIVWLAFDSPEFPPSAPPSPMMKATP